MTAINIETDIPSGIVTLEQLAAWSVMALRRTNPTIRILEQQGQDPQRVIQTALIQADDDTIRLVGRISMPIDPDYASKNDQKLWMHAQNISNVELPVSFKQN